MNNPFDGFQRGLMTGGQMGQGMYRARGDRTYAGQIAARDYTGAAATAGQYGDTQGAERAQGLGTDQQKQQAEQRTEALIAGIRYLQSFPEETRPQAFAQMRSQLSTIFEPEMLDQLSGADMSDQSLNAFGAAIGAEAERLQLFQTRSGDIVGVSQRTGREGSRISAPAEAFDPMDGAPQGFRWADEQRSRLVPIPGYIEGRSQISAAGRAPSRPRSSAPSSSSSGGNLPSAQLPGNSSLPPGFTIRRR